MKMKLLATCMAVICAVSAISLPAFAEDTIAVDKIEAEDYIEWYDATEEDIADTEYPGAASRDPLKVEGGGTGTQVAGTGHKNWLLYESMDFGTGYDGFYARYSAKASRCAPDARLEVRLDDVESEAVCVLQTPATNPDNWDNYQTVSVHLDTPITGVHNVYIYMLGEPASNDLSCIGNFDYFGFTKTAVTSVALNKEELAMETGTTATLLATVAPENAVDPTLTWTSSDPTVATVVSGIVSAHKAGSTVVTAESENGKTATCVVRVSDPVTKEPQPDAPVVKTPTNGTAKVNGKTVLYKSGKKVTGTKVIAVGKKTYAVVKGYVATGKTRVVKVSKTKSYVVNKYGIVQKGSKNKLVKVGNKSYIVNKYGVIQKNNKKNMLVKIGKKAYVVNKQGVVYKKKTVKVGKVSYKTNKYGVATKVKK